MKWYHYLLFTAPVLVYLILRLGFRGTIEFGYDQPRLATRVIEFIKNGDLLQTQKFAEKSPWGNVSWGPSLFYLLSPFFLISKNPLTVSLLISVFNFVSVLLIIYLGKRYFSFGTGLIAGIFLATMPWWWIFSRMIYQPTLVPSFIAIMIFLTFKVLEKPKTFWIVPLVFTWGVLLQLYFHTFSAVGVSTVFVAYKFRKISYKYLILGIVLTSFLFLPYLKGQSVSDYLPEKTKETLVQGRDNPLSRVKTLVPKFILIISGGDFSWQLGNGYDDFVSANPKVENVFSIISVLTVLVVIYNLFTVIKFSKNRSFKLALLLWTIAPIPLLVFIPLPSIPPIPRYFLLTLPSLSLLWGICIDEVAGSLSKKIKALKYGFIILFLTIPFFWFCFDLKYYQFVTTYSYPNGPLSVYSDIPYAFLINSINFVFKDSNNRGGSNVVISNDRGNPKQYALDWATNYVWTYVYKRDRILPDITNVDYYLITVSQASNPEYKYIYKSGPYWVYRVTSL